MPAQTRPSRPPSSPASPKRPRTIVPAPRELAIQRALVLTVVIAPVAGLAIAVVSLWGRGIGAADAVAFALFYAITALGITVGYRRLFAHRAFDAAPVSRGVLAIAGCLALQGPVARWVADHRRHHAFSDKEGDPHSPHRTGASGCGHHLRDAWHAHLGWLFDREKTEVASYAPDLLADPVISRIDRVFWLWVIFTLALPSALGLGRGRAQRRPRSGAGPCGSSSCTT